MIYQYLTIRNLDYVKFKVKKLRGSYFLLCKNIKKVLLFSILIEFYLKKI